MANDNSKKDNLKSVKESMNILSRARAFFKGLSERLGFLKPKSSSKIIPVNPGDIDPNTEVPNPQGKKGNQNKTDSDSNSLNTDIFLETKADQRPELTNKAESISHPEQGLMADQSMTIAFKEQQMQKISEAAKNQENNPETQDTTKLISDVRNILSSPNKKKK